MLRRFNAVTVSAVATTRFTATQNEYHDKKEGIPHGQLRWDDLGPRTYTHTRNNLMTVSFKSRKDFIDATHKNGPLHGEPQTHWIEDPKNWAELNKECWEDMDKNAKKMFVMPRMQY